MSLPITITLLHHIHFDHSYKKSTKDTKKDTEKNKKRNPQHNKWPNFLKQTYSKPSRTVTNGAKYKTKAWKRYQVIKPRRARRSIWWSLQLTMSSLKGRPKWSPTNSTNDGSPTLRSSSMPPNIIAPKI